MFYLLRLTWRYAGTERYRLFLFYALFIVADLIGATSPLVLAKMIEALQKPGANLWHELLFWSGVLFSLTLLLWAFHGPARIIERRFAFGVYQRYVRHLYRCVMELPLRWHQDHHSGDTLNRVSKAGKSLFRFGQDQFVHIDIAIRYFGSLLFLALLCWWLALTVLGLSFLVLAAIRLLDRKLMRIAHRVNEREHHLSAAYYDYIGNIVSVLTLRLAGRAREEVDRRFAAMKPPFDEQVVYNEKKWFSLSLCVNFIRAAMLALYMGVVLHTGQEIEIPKLVAIFQYLGFINDAFFWGTSYAETILQGKTDVKAVEEIEADHAALAVEHKANGPETFKRIEIEHISFAHQEGTEELAQIDGINLRIDAGQKIALVGASGAGKTTLLTLLRGLYEAKEARMILDGKTYDTLAPLFGFTTLIPQDAEIFENTIRYNLTMGLDVPDAILEALLALVDLTSLIASLPKGLETDIRERGVNLSGGQKQRLALARGLLAGRDSALLLLDEPTSNVDLGVEEKIFTALFDVCADKAMVASLHRLHLLPRFDWVVVMRDGRIVEQGPFAALLATNGALHALWHRHVVRKEGIEEETQET